MKIGDQVLLVKIPPDIPQSAGLSTRQLFEKCLGHTFTVAGLDTVEGLPYKLVRIDVGQILGKEPFMETIWVEPECLELVST